MKIAILVVAGIVLPLILLPVIKITGFSEIVEEIAKALVVLFLILKLPTWKLQILGGIAFGFLFGMSENFFYLNNIFQLGDFSIFWQRFIWIIPMHIITVLVMVFAGLARKWFLIFGLAGAIVLHILFNGIVIEFLMR
ncbi:PrsW family intramembrane metalloprotease [Candidatus Falkowbacteria bacterium]|nr:PrsW family intramembrane metalloprotease [Candidatus Falkowbacteria bacterium]